MARLDRITAQYPKVHDNDTITFQLTVPFSMIRRDYRLGIEFYGKLYKMIDDEKTRRIEEQERRTAHADKYL